MKVHSRLEVDKHTSYSHISSIHDFQKACLWSTKKDLYGRITSSQYYSILIDESTDMAVNQNMLTDITTFNEGEPETHFLLLKRVKTASAVTL